MNEYSLHTPTEGINLDTDPRLVKSSQMTYANDMEIYGTDSGKDYSAYPLPSSLELFSIPPIVAQYQYVRAKYDHAVATEYEYEITLSNGNIISGGSIRIAVGANLTAHVALLNTALSAYGYNATFGSQTGIWFTLAIYQTTNTPIPYTLRQGEIVGSAFTEIAVYTVQDAFNPSGAIAAQMKPLQGYQIKDFLFVMSVSGDGTAYEYGYAKPNVSGVWSYTSLIQTRNLPLPSDQVIEVQAEEISNNQYGIYWDDNTYKSKVLSIPTSLTSPLKYTMTVYEDPTEGLQTLESINAQTNQQIQNFGRVEFGSQGESGGSLPSGTLIYYIASGIDKNYSEWSGGSEPIPVFLQGASAPSAGANMRGDKTPQVTSKTNTITVIGVDLKIYNSVKLGVVVNQGGVQTGYIIGEYDTQVGSFDITHTGFEPTIESYDKNLFPPVQDVILRSKNNQTKKNRNNKANIERDIDRDLRDMFSAATLGQTRTGMSNVGYVKATSQPLFRASVNTPYVLIGTEYRVLSMTDATTPPNFNSGAYNLTTFTAPSAGDYTVTYSLLASSEIADSTITIAEIRNLGTTGSPKNLVYAYKTGFSLSDNTIVTSTESVTLDVGDRLNFTIFVYKKVRGIYTGITIQAGTSFAISKNINDFPSKYLRVGEYQVPSNVATLAGYMVNERYPFFGRVKYKTGFLSQWYYMGTKRFDGGASYATQTTGALSDGTSLTNSAIYSYGLTVSGLNVSTIKDEIVYIEFGRGLVQPTILGTGIAIASHGNIGSAVYGGQFRAGLYTGNTDQAVTYGNVNNSSSDNRYFAFLLCPDWITGSIKPTFQTGDYIINYGCQDSLLVEPPTVSGSRAWGSFREFLGFFIGGGASAPDIIDVVDADYTLFNTASKTLLNVAISKYLGLAKNNDGTIDTLATEGMAVTLEARLNQVGPFYGLPFGDFGCYYFQYVRPADIGPIEDLKIVSCNTFVDVVSSTDAAIPTQVVFGGDTYTQKTYTKILYNAVNPDTTKLGTLSSFIGYYSQNRINEQLRYTDPTFTDLPFPMGNNITDYLFGRYEAQEQFQIDAGYTWYNPLGNGTVFNIKIPQQSTFHARIIFSLQKVSGATEDAYRTFLPLNFTDLGAKNGGINALIDLGTSSDIMFAIQPLMVTVLPYQSDVGLSAEDGSLYVGNGGVYAQRGTEISTFGAAIKSAILLAKNQAGNRQLYWLSQTGQSLMRYGGDGIKSLSDENFWRTWFINSTKLIRNEFDAVLGYDKNRKLIFVTARAVNTDVSVWSDAVTYTTGDYVRYAPIGNSYQNFEHLPDVYRAISVSTGSNPYNYPALWEYIPITNMEYYNYWSCMFNEKGNYFQGFFSLLPSRYFNFLGSIILPRMRAPYNLMYDLFGGTGYLRWLDDSGVYKQGTFIMEWVGNKYGAIPKRWEWFGMSVGEDHDTANNPSAEVTTETQSSLTTGLTQFDFENSQLAQGIFQDISDNPLISAYCKVRLATQSYYRVYAMAIHFYIKYRPITK